MLHNAWLKRCVLLVIAYLLYLWSWNTTIFAEEINKDSFHLTLKGYLGKEELASALHQLEGELTEVHQIVIMLNSTSGDLNQVLEFAKKIYQLKIEKEIHIALYIDENAIGPSAIFPFLADDLYVSLFVSWGDIPLDNKNALSTNILRNRVISLIDPSHPQAQLLRLIAAAMCDPAIRIVEDKGWHLEPNENMRNIPEISSKGETLVINHNQLKELGLIKGIMTLEKFQALYPYKSQHTPPNPETFPSLEGRPIPQIAFDEELKKHIIFDPKGPNNIGHILIDDRSSGINESTWLYVKKALDSYKESKESKPIFVILELNTPGGEVFAAQKISDALKDLDTQYNIPVVAYINNWAISAGAMLAYSCRFIITTKDGSMGAAEPVMLDQAGKMEAASEKVNSAIRSDFASRAQFFNRNPDIAEAMVDKDIILVLRHGRVMRLNSEDQIQRTGPEADILISPKGKLLTLSAEKMIEYGVADRIVPPTKTDLITSEEQTSGNWPASRMGLFHQPFFKDIPDSKIDSYRMDWKTRFFVFLATPAVSSLLFFGLIVGFYLEMNSPGLGIPAALAFTCLFLIIISSFSLEIANWLELILLLVGVAIILIELFIVPTFGFLGFLGVLFFLAGLFGMMIPGIDRVNYEFNTHSFNAAGEVVLERLAWFSGTFVAALIMIAILARYVTPNFGAFKRFVLSGNEQNGYIAGENPSTLPQVGRRGEAISTLRPSGKIVIGDTLYDAMSTGSFIEKGSEIVVVKLDGSVIIVDQMNQTEPDKA